MHKAQQSIDSNHPAAAQVEAAVPTPLTLEAASSQVLPGKAIARRSNHQRAAADVHRGRIEVVDSLPADVEQTAGLVQRGSAVVVPNVA